MERMTRWLENGIDRAVGLLEDHLPDRLVEVLMPLFLPAAALLFILWQHQE